MGKPQVHHGISANGVDFDALYQWLERLSVVLPDIDPGCPINQTEIAQCMLRVQNCRTQAEQVATLLERRLGEIKRKVDILTEARRLEKAEALANVNIRSLAKVDRDAAIDASVGHTSAKLATAKGEKSQVEAALKAVRAHMDTLEMAKQTLNAVLRIADDTGYRSHTFRR